MMVPSTIENIEVGTAFSESVILVHLFPDPVGMEAKRKVMAYQYPVAMTPNLEGVIQIQVPVKAKTFIQQP